MLKRNKHKALSTFYSVHMQFGKIIICLNEPYFFRIIRTNSLYQISGSIHKSIEFFGRFPFLLRTTEKLSFFMPIFLFMVLLVKNAAAGYQDPEDPSQVLGCP